MSVANEGERWYALHVRPRFEGIAVLKLEGKGYPAYLPPYRLRPRRSYSARDIEIPLFPGYIFCKFDYAARGRILLIPGVISVASFAGDRIAVPEGEILAVKRIVESKLDYSPLRYVDAGRLVRVAAGPLLGLEGFALETTGNCRVIRSVNLLRRSVAVTVDRRCITPIEQC
jgi:transcription antitermination factor NusG